MFLESNSNLPMKWLVFFPITDNMIEGITIKLKPNFSLLVNTSHVIALKLLKLTILHIISTAILRLFDLKNTQLIHTNKNVRIQAKNL